MHKWRTEEHAILIGAQTAIDDNPRLTSRDWAGTSPVRIVIDRMRRIPKENHIFDNRVKTIVISTEGFLSEKENIIFEPVNFEEDVAEQTATLLFKQQIQSVIIEGGAKTIQAFIDAGLWDEARLFIGNVEFKKGTKAPVLNKIPAEKHSVANDELLIFLNHD